ncbi:APC family permease [Paenibacillus sp. MZ04-78.2]|uniref:APC family permease n=1 Tax=Paenibacillus sp. MZ04-78.2 TaxID=2962034 RepID=UPI0020B65DE0|nr:APC family permease [Paenibacillus sp. MZ04-78.2]MCP3772764.1 APC family permease [Paenibacillus sp. MZ04-78.2]
MTMSEVMIQSTENERGTNLGYKQELKRSLTLKDLIIYGLVTMLPIAPIAVYGLIVQGSYGMVPLVYLVGIVAMVFTAMSYSKMSNEFPIAGSVYNYVQRGLNPHVGFVTGWMIAGDYIMAPALQTAFAAKWLNSILPAVPTFVFIIVFIAINTFITARGISLTARTNLFFLIVEIAILVIFLGFAFKFVFIDGHGAGGFSLAPIFQADKIDFQFIAGAASIAVLGFLGFDVISTLSEEVKDPQKTVGRATVSSLVIIGLIFIVQTYLAALAHPNYEGLDPDMAFFDIAREVGGDFLYYLFILVGVAAVGIANALAIQSAISRIIYSMSRDKLLPFSGKLGNIHPKYKTPFNATIFVGIVSLFVALLGSIEMIVQLINFGALTAFMVLNLTVFNHFYVKKGRRDVKGLIHYLLLPMIGFLIILYVWSGFDRMTFIVGISWMVVGVVMGAVKSKGYKQLPPVMKDM